VDRDDQVKGYEVAPDDYVVLEAEEVAAAVPDSDKTLTVTAFVACDDIDDVYFDKPYYLAPADRHADEAFALIREGMRLKKVAALAQTVLFRRVRTVLIRAHGAGLIATTLNFDYEVRSAEQAFDDIPDLKIEGEMLELAEHIINTKKGAFDPAAFDDRYEAALADLVKAKLEGKALPAKKRAPPAKTTDLMTALRESAGLGTKPKKPKAAVNANRTRAPAAKPKAAPARRKAG
jgi:DNA end-binding protein Ku